MPRAMNKMLNISLRLHHIFSMYTEVRFLRISSNLIQVLFGLEPYGRFDTTASTLYALFPWRYLNKLKQCVSTF
jgi:hypothetical protein